MRLRSWLWIMSALSFVLLALAATQAGVSITGSAGELALWQMIRASGLIAYLLLSIAVAMGVSVNARALDSIMRRAWVYEAHQTISLLALAFTLVHILLLFANRHVPLTVIDVLVPLASPWRAIPLALGTLSLYLIVILVLSSYARKTIGQKVWRIIHYGGFAGWVMALAHGIAAGSDTTDIWVQYFYLITGSATLLLIVFRILTSSPVRHRRTVRNTVQPSESHAKSADRQRPKSPAHYRLP